MDVHVNVYARVRSITFADVQKRKDKLNEMMQVMTIVNSNQGNGAQLQEEYEII